MSRNRWIILGVIAAVAFLLVVMVLSFMSGGEQPDTLVIEPQPGANPSEIQAGQ